MSSLYAALAKEALLQWRSRSGFVAVLVFGAVTLLMFSFGIGPNSEVLRLYSSSFLWLALMLASTLSLAESFRHETENRALEGLLLLPASSRSIFYGKSIANWLHLVILGILLVPLMIVLYDAPATRAPGLLAVILLGSAGLSAPGTLYAAMTAEARGKQVLLPLLLFPLVVPVLISSVKASSLILLGDPMRQIPSWIVLLTAFDVIYWAICGLMFPKVVEEM
ncbi:MAG: heme exporter protein CcmB [Thermoanaerobaculia bacterium]|nr:heme exporter protein CcmB [Thermoanaerobaculia bacterium]